MSAIHDLHIWGMSTTESALTVHLVTPAGYPGDAFVDAVAHELAEQGTTDHACALCRPMHVAAHAH